jgi:hypothetical protein
MARVHAHEVVDDAVLLKRATRQVASLRAQVATLQDALRKATAGTSGAGGAGSGDSAAAALAALGGLGGTSGGGVGGGFSSGAAASLYGGAAAGGGPGNRGGGSSGRGRDGADAAAFAAFTLAAPLPLGGAGDAYTRGLRVENAKLAAENRKLKDKLRKQKDTLGSSSKGTKGSSSSSSSRLGGGAAGYLRYDGALSAVRGEAVGSENDADNVPYPEGGGPLTQRLAAVDGRVKRLEAKKRADAEFAKPVGTVWLLFRASRSPPFPLFSCRLLFRFAHSGTAISFLIY